MSLIVEVPDAVADSLPLPHGEKQQRLVIEKGGISRTFKPKGYPHEAER